jgi:hypothetical protein
VVDQARLAEILAPRSTLITEATINAFRDRPEFPALLRGAVEGWLEVFHGSPPPVRHLAKDRGGFLLGLLMMGLQGQAGTISLNELKAFAQAGRIASPGRVSAFVGYLAQKKLIDLIEGGAGAALRLNEGLVTYYRRMFSNDARVLLPISPEAAVVRGLLEGDGAEECALWMIATSTMADRMTPYGLLLELPSERNAGLQIMWDLLNAGVRADGSFSGEAEVSISALARRYEVSRPHVRKLLDDCAAAGCLTWSGPRQITFTRTFIDAARTGWARIFLTNWVTYQAWLEHRGIGVGQTAASVDA